MCISQSKFKHESYLPDKDSKKKFYEISINWLNDDTHTYLTPNNTTSIGCLMNENEEQTPKYK